MVNVFCKFRCLRAVLAGAALLAFSCAAQASAPIPKTVEDVLHQMSDKADIIFVGQVVALHPSIEGGTASGTVAIDFHIDQAVRGCSVGGTYVLREWAGLWSGNNQRYQIGQRLLMMLRAPGPSGLSSPVAGLDGAIPVHHGITATPLSDASAASQISVVDLRWLGAKLEHPASYRLQSVLSPTPLTLSQQMASASAPSGELIANSVTAEDSSSRVSVPIQQASVDTVIQLLASWRKAASDVR